MWRATVHPTHKTGSNQGLTMTDINGTYANMYLVFQNETYNGDNVPFALVDDGTQGSDPVHPAEENITISGAPSTLIVGQSDLTIAGLGNAGPQTFVYEGVYQTTTFDDGILVKSLGNNQYYFITNAAFDGSNNPAGAQLFQTNDAVPGPECFFAGTMILCPVGEVPVENLKPGDLVLTSDRARVPVRWIGRHTVSRLFTDPLRLLPIRVKAGAFDENVPCRDLLVSPDHALFIDGLLIHAAALVNGTSIVRESNVPMNFTYYHVEVDNHSLVLAENTPVETFVDNVDRTRFDNWGEYQALYPEGKAIVELPYARAKAYRQVPRLIREKLAERGVALYGANISSAA
jgi:Hint domain